VLHSSCRLLLLLLLLLLLGCCHQPASRHTT
jgi:hypothetical protein